MPNLASLALAVQWPLIAFCLCPPLHFLTQVPDNYSTVLQSIPSFRLRFLQLNCSKNETLKLAASLKTFEIPFYVSDSFLYFNVSKANEIGMEDMYHVVIAANGTEPGMVGMVLTTVSVERGECSPLCL